MGTDRSVLERGAIGGVLAATAIVLFFLFVDLVEAEPFRTPAFLTTVLLGSENAPGAIGIMLFTILHYAVFAAVGVGVAWALEAARIPAALLLGVVVGFFLFDVVFYASISLTGVDVARELGWPTFLAGNLLGGLVLMGYLARTAPGRRRGWSELLREHTVVREGLAAGLLGAVALAGWFFFVDLAMGRLLFTPAALGSALFHGVVEAAGVQYTALTILGYTAVHLAAFGLIGLGVAALVTQSEENPSLVLALVLLFVTFETLMVGLIAIVAAWLLDQISWWGILVGNLIAAAVMGAYLWRRHPRLSGDLKWAEQTAAEGSPGARERPSRGAREAGPAV